MMTAPARRPYRRVRVRPAEVLLWLFIYAVCIGLIWVSLHPWPQPVADPPPPLEGPRFTRPAVTAAHQHPPGKDNPPMLKDSTSYCHVCGAIENDAAISGDFLPYTCPPCQALIDQLAPATVARIDAMRYEAMLERNRNAAPGSYPFADPAMGDYFLKVMARKRAEVGPAAHTAASKAIGWDGDH